MPSQIITQAATQLYFEREPPYRQEQILRAQGEEVKVHFNLKKREAEIQQVRESNKVEETKRIKVEDKEAKMDLTGPLSPEDAIERMLKIKEKVSFDSLSESQQSQVVAKIINGEFDDIVFKGIQTD